MVELVTNRLILNPLQYEDIDPLHQLWTSPGVRKYLWDDEIIPLEQTREVVMESINMFQRFGYGIWGARLKKDNRFIGFSGFWYFHQPPELQLLYGVAQTYWQKGFAPEMATAIIDYGFNQLSFDEIVASTDAPNMASIIVMEKLGMLFWKRVTKGTGETIYFRKTKL